MRITYPTVGWQAFVSMCQCSRLFFCKTKTPAFSGAYKYSRRYCILDTVMRKQNQADELETTEIGLGVRALKLTQQLQCSRTKTVSVVGHCTCCKRSVSGQAVVRSSGWHRIWNAGSA